MIVQFTNWSCINANISLCNDTINEHYDVHELKFLNS